MQIKETIGVSFPGPVERPPLEDVVVLVDGAGVAPGVQRAVSARVSGVRDGASSLVASRYVEIPLVGSDGEVSGILYHGHQRADRRGAVAAGGPARVRAMGDLTQFVDDINNLLAVIGSSLRLLECQSDAAYRKAVVEKMQEAFARGAMLRRQVLDTARPRPTSIDGFVAGYRFAAIAATLDRGLRPAITVRTEIARDLWAFHADPKEQTNAAGSGTGLALPQVQHFAAGRGGAVWIESEQGSGTPARLFLPGVHATGLPSIVGTEITYTPTPNGGVLHVINPATAAPTS
jgi:hypothetical protein